MFDTMKLMRSERFQRWMSKRMENAFSFLALRMADAYNGEKFRHGDTKYAARKLAEALHRMGKEVPLKDEVWYALDVLESVFDGYTLDEAYNMLILPELKEEYDGRRQQVREGGGRGDT